MLVTSATYFFVFVLSTFMLNTFLLKNNKILFLLKRQNRITRKRQVHGAVNRHTLHSAKKLWAEHMG